MTKRKNSIGFGFDSNESEHHFLVEIPKENKGSVIIYERFEWNNDKDIQKIDYRFDTSKVRLSKHKWNAISGAIKSNFNIRLQEKNYKGGAWKIGQVPVQRLLGKEMVLLAWAIEDCDPSIIPNAIKNWNGLKPEERWWLFTMTNAATGNIDDKRGWRIALRYAITENPILEKRKQASIFEQFIENKI